MSAGKVVHMTVMVKVFKYRDRNFTIVKKEDYYCAIEDKYIDVNGKMKCRLNVLQMFASVVLEETIKRVQDSVDIEYYITQGMTKAEAFCKVFNCQHMVEAVEKSFA